ncbi:MAG: GNAT family N-acetyltransferase [Ruminococcaceae bacterium]|nr:GNAT family N-acetyltransferase [Oscillospiraceae bacterium]
MNYTIEKIDENNHSLFDDMVFWRENGYEREPSQEPVSEQIKKELLNPDLYVYAVKVDGRYVGWISCVYIAKVGKWKGHGHIYVDELWVEPSFRGNGFAKALLKKADELKDKFNATGIRLYVNVNNPVAQNLYETCGYVEDGRAIFMEK